MSRFSTKYGRNSSKYRWWSPVVIKCALMRNVSYAKRNCRNRSEIVRGFREIVGAWLLSHLLLQKLFDGKQECFRKYNKTFSIIIDIIDGLGYQ